MGRWAWTKVIVHNRQTIYDLAKEAVVTWRAGRRDRLLKAIHTLHSQQSRIARLLDASN